MVVDSTTVSNVCGTGINVAPLSGQATPVLIQESELIDNGTGVAATAGGQVFLVDTFFARNTVPTSAAGGSITVESSVPTPDPVIITEPVVPTAQKLVACKALPKKLRPRATKVLLAHTCVTTGGKRVTVKVIGKAKRLTRKQGKVLVETKKSGKVTITYAAPGDQYFLAFTQSRTYRL